MLLNVNQVAFGLGCGVLGATQNRMGIWTQGCSLPKCPGCSSTHTWSPGQGKQVGIEALLGLAQAQPTPPSGLMLSGGEPTDQAEAVAALVEAFRAAFPGAEVILYTGLRWSILTARHAKLVAFLDVAVTGPYVRTLDATPLSGSRNQEVRLLTPLAKRLYRDWKTWPLHALQIGHLSGNRLVTVGIPDTHRMERAARQIGFNSVTWRAHVQTNHEDRS